MYRLIAAVIFSSLLCASAAHAGEIRSYSPGSDKVSGKLQGPQQSRFESDEGYFETWMYMLYLKGGAWVQIRFILTNVGPGDSHAAVDVMRYGPPLSGEDKKRVFTRHIDKIEQSVRKNVAVPLDLIWRNCRLTKTKKGYRIKIDAKGYHLEVDLASRGPHWRPGDGEIKFPDGGRFGVHLMPALARVTGREKMGDGEWRQVKGTGWGEHAFTNVLAHRLSKRFLRFHGRKGNVAVMYHELFTPENFGEERMGFIVVTKGSKVLASSLVAVSNPSKFKKDRPWPHHRVPMTYTVRATTKAGDIVLEVQAGARIYREDVLSTVPGWVRRVVQMFIQPVNFYNRARWKVTLPDGTKINGRGVSLYSPMRAKL